MTLVTRALADIRAERDALLADFDAWKGRASVAGDMKEHHTQVERVTAMLQGTLAAALEPTALAKDDGVLVKLDDIAEPRNAVEVVHVIWDFFRDKLTQRDTARYKDHLGAADELALDCYLRFVEAKVASLPDDKPDLEEALRASLKEPPLVSYTPERGLFSQSRMSAFRPHGLDSVDVDKFRSALQRLPVPIVTAPWSHARRASCLVFVAHETGHLVADDLELNDEMKAMVAALPLQGDPALWLEWLPEVFGDVFATAALGTAYVDELAAFLAGKLSDIRGEEPTASKEYPTRALRLALCSAALEVQQLPAYPFWEEAYGSATPAKYVDDAKLIARELIDGKFAGLDGKTVRKLLDWTPTEEKHAGNVATALLSGAAPQVPFTIRRWIAGAALAKRRDPVKYRERKVDDEVVETIAKQRPAGVRSKRTAAVRNKRRATRGGGPAADAAAEAADLNKDRAAGKKLAVLLGLVK